MKLKLKGWAFRDGSKFPKDKAQATGRALDTLRKRHGAIKAPIIVEAARPESSDLHYAFTWDDNLAAEKCRLQEARDLLSAIRVVYEVGGEDRLVPAFVNLTIEAENEDDEDERGYHGIVSAASDQTLRSMMLDQAKKELLAWRHRYAILTDFARLFAEIDKL